MCRVFTESHEVYVIYLVVSNFWSTDDMSALGEDLMSLPSRCERLFLFADVPHGQFIGEKTTRILGWRPRHQFAAVLAQAGLTGAGVGDRLSRMKR